jgi:hypothetical protein
MHNSSGVARLFQRGRGGDHKGFCGECKPSTEPEADFLKLFSHIQIILFAFSPSFNFHTVVIPMKNITYK